MNLVVLVKSRKKTKTRKKSTRKASPKKESYNVNGVGELAFIEMGKRGMKQKKKNPYDTGSPVNSVDNDTYWTKSKYQRYIKVVGSALKAKVGEGIRWTDPSAMAQEVADGILMEKPNLKIYLRKQGVNIGNEAEQLAKDIYMYSIKSK